MFSEMYAVKYIDDIQGEVVTWYCPTQRGAANFIRDITAAGFELLEVKTVKESEQEDA